MPTRSSTWIQLNHWRPEPIRPPRNRRNGSAMSRRTAASTRARTPGGRWRRARRAAPRPGRPPPSAGRRRRGSRSPAGSPRRPARHRGRRRHPCPRRSRGPSAAGGRGASAIARTMASVAASRLSRIARFRPRRPRPRPDRDAGQVDDGVGPIEGRGRGRAFVPRGSRRPAAPVGLHVPAARGDRGSRTSTDQPSSRSALREGGARSCPTRRRSRPDAESRRCYSHVASNTTRTRYCQGARYGHRHERPRTGMGPLPTRDRGPRRSGSSWPMPGDRWAHRGVSRPRSPASTPT